MSAEEIESLLIARLAQMLKLPPQEVNPSRPLEEYGFDSMEAVALTGQIETELGRVVNAALFWDYPTIRAVARYLASSPSEQAV